MSHAAGTRLGPYEIAAPLGAGGMGEVYRTERLRRAIWEGYNGHPGGAHDRRGTGD
jgi:hypothetical protein